MRYLRAGRFLRNSKGLSLVELMVGMGVASVIALIASFAFLMAFDVYIRSIRQYETEQEMSALMYGLRASMVTASYLRYGGVADATDNATTNRPNTGDAVGFGRIFATSDTAPATSYTGELQLVAQFNRERSFADTQGSLEAVQIVYQRPNVGTRDSGAIYIDTERNPAAGGGWVRLRPVNAPQMFTRLTNFEIDNIRVIDAQGRVVNNTTATGNVCLNNAGALVSCVNRQVLSAEITMTMRYFSKGTEAQFQWCNRNRFGANAGCSNMTGVGRTDIDRKMNLVFANNALQRGEYLPRRPFGNLYFFAPWAPYRRPQ